METLSPGQEIRPSEAMPDVRMLLLQQVQKYRVCDGDPEKWARDPSMPDLYMLPPQQGQKHRICNGAPRS